MPQGGSGTAKIFWTIADDNLQNLYKVCGSKGQHLHASSEAIFENISLKSDLN